MADSDDRSEVIYDSGMGPLEQGGVTGASVEFQEDGTVHHTVHGEDRHFSWDSHRDGSVSGVHGRDHSKPDNRPW